MQHFEGMSSSPVPCQLRGFIQQDAPREPKSDQAPGSLVFRFSVLPIRGSFVLIGCIAQTDVSRAALAISDMQCPSISLT